MIGLEELCALVEENNQKIVEIEAENRVLNKLINIEKSRCEVNEQVVEEQPQQDDFRSKLYDK